MGDMSLSEKQNILNKLVKKTQKDNGGATHVLAFAKDRVDELKYEFIPTTSERLNGALGGGFVRSKISEVAGENSAGKNSLILETIGLDHANDPDSMWGWYETENDFIMDYAVLKGVDPNRLLVWEIDDKGAEHGLDTLEMLIRSNTLKGIVVNSVAGLTPKKELESEMARQGVGEQARIMSKLMRKIVAICARTKTAVIFINQLRTDIMVTHGDNNTTTGGRALRFYATQRVRLSKVKVKAEDGMTEEEGMKVNVKILKNRVANDNPYKATSYKVYYGQGIDRIGELADLAVEAEIVETLGSWIYYPTKAAFITWANEDGTETEMKFQSKAKFADYIRSSKSLQATLTEQLRAGKVRYDSLDDSDIIQIEKEEKDDKTDLGDLLADIPE